MEEGDANVCTEVSVDLRDDDGFCSIGVILYVVRIGPTKVLIESSKHSYIATSKTLLHVRVHRLCLHVPSPFLNQKRTKDFYSLSSVTHRFRLDSILGELVPYSAPVHQPGAIMPSL